MFNQSRLNKIIPIRKNKPFQGWCLFFNISAYLLLSLSAHADNQSEMEHMPSTNEFIDAFMGSEPQSDVNNANKVTYRGISLKKNTSHSDKKISQNNFNSLCNAKNKVLSVNITFKSNSSNVEQKTHLKNIADAMNSSQLSNCYFVIEGHSDAVGNAYYNLWLSQKRAGQIKQHLNEYNVSEDRLIVVGKGEDELIDTVNPNGEKNRRVVFKIINFQH